MGKRRRRPPGSLAHPRYWPTWLGLALFRLSIFLPWKAQVWLGRGVGWLAFHILRLRRRIVLVNLRLCFPQLGEKQRLRLAADHYRAMGIGFFETGLAWWGSRSRLPEYEIHGAGHLEQASALGKGVILLTAHFTTLEICGRLLLERFHIGCLFRNPDNPVVSWQMRRNRTRKMAVSVPMDDLRGLIRALRDNHIIWYAPDQGRRGKLSTIVPFFGEPAMTSTATSRLASMTGAPVVPYFAKRRPDGSYLLTILPALENFPTEDSVADTLRINRLIEESIRGAPEQYFWIHRRFKRRGPGLPNVYR